MKWILFCVVNEIFCNFAGIRAYMLESLIYKLFSICLRIDLTHNYDRIS